MQERTNLKQCGRDHLPIKRVSQNLKAEVVTTYSEVETREVEQPTVCVPGPAGNGTVHNGGPAESENHRRHDAATLERPTNNQLNCHRTKEHLVQTKHDLGKESRAGRWSGHDVLHAKVLHVTDERTGCTRVCERVAPEQPLKADASQVSPNPSQQSQFTYTPMTARDWNRRDNADLRRARPAYKKAIPGMMSHTKNAITMRYK